MPLFVRTGQVKVYLCICICVFVYLCICVFVYLCICMCVLVFGDMVSGLEVEALEVSHDHLQKLCPREGWGEAGGRN